MLILLVSCDTNREEIYKNMSEVDFKCPPNAQAEISGWGKNGLSRTCKTRNGHWQGWDNGVLRVDGYYLNDKKHGEWVWYTKEGDVEKKVTYRNGVEESAQ